MTPYILNLIDLALTLYALANGGVEMNPLMQSVPVMVGWKVVGVGVLCWWLSKQSNYLAKWGLNLCTAIYAFYCIGHLFFILKGLIL